MDKGKKSLSGLHKFTTIETLLKILQPNNGFRFSAVKDLNDVFECVDLKNTNLYTLSFSKSHSNLLLWAHYANKHTGCSIKINLKKYTHLTFEEVEYVSRKIRKSACTDSNKLCKKGKRWQYENEYRLIINPKEEMPYEVFSSKTNEKVEYYLTPYIDEVAFGCNVENSYEYLQILKIIKNINDAAKQKNKRRKNDILKVKKYKIAENGFELIWDTYQYEEVIIDLEKKAELGELKRLNKCEECELKNK